MSSDTDLESENGVDSGSIDTVSRYFPALLSRCQICRKTKKDRKMLLPNFCRISADTCCQKTTEMPFGRPLLVPYRRLEIWDSNDTRSVFYLMSSPYKLSVNMMTPFSPRATRRFLHSLVGSFRVRSLTYGAQWRSSIGRRGETVNDDDV